MIQPIIDFVNSLTSLAVFAASSGEEMIMGVQ